MNHIPAKTAWEKSSNVFIWTPRTDLKRVAFNWRIGDDQPMTHETVYRWLDLIMKESENQEADLHYLVFPVIISLDKTRPLSYNIDQDPQGEPLSRDGKDILKEGDYALYCSDGSIPSEQYIYHRDEDFLAQEEGILESLESMSAFLVLPRVDAQERDRGLCSITGVELLEDELELTWIVPPVMFHRMPKYEKKDRTDIFETFVDEPEARESLMKPMLCLSNCLQMNNKLVKAFQTNRIAIDVDDNYRIICFYGREVLEEGITDPIATHLVLRDHPNKPADEFLRAHFLYSLTVRIQRGGIAEHYDRTSVNCFLLEMGVIRDEYDINEPPWKTELGLQVHAWLLKREPITWEKMPRTQSGRELLAAEFRKCEIEIKK